MPGGARPDELADLAGALTLLCRAGLGPPVIQVWIRDGVAAVAAGGVGRRTVVVSAGLVRSVAEGGLTPDQAAAVIAHAAVLVRQGWVRSDPVIAWWSVPWDLLRALAEGVARAGRGLPVTSLAWRVRVVVAVVAVVQFLQQGYPGMGVFIGALAAVSYAMPVWRRAWAARMVAAGDTGLAEAGFGPAMVAFLRRCPDTAVTRSRIRALGGGPAAARPLGLALA